MTRRELFTALMALPLLVKVYNVFGYRGADKPPWATSEVLEPLEDRPRTHPDVQRLNEARERIKALPVEWGTQWEGDQYVRSASFVHPDNGKRYGLAFTAKCDAEPGVMTYGRIKQIDAKLETSLVFALAFPDKGIQAYNLASTPTKQA